VLYAVALPQVGRPRGGECWWGSGLTEGVVTPTAAKKFMLGAAIAYNLKKWLNFKAPQTKTATMAFKNAATAVHFSFSGYGNFCIITAATAK